MLRFGTRRSAATRPPVAGILRSFPATGGPGRSTLLDTTGHARSPSHHDSPLRGRLGLGGPTSSRRRASGITSSPRHTRTICERRGSGRPRSILEIALATVPQRPPSSSAVSPAASRSSRTRWPNLCASSLFAAGPTRRPSIDARSGCFDFPVGRDLPVMRVYPGQNLKRVTCCVVHRVKYVLDHPFVDHERCPAIAALLSKDTRR